MSDQNTNVLRPSLRVASRLIKGRALVLDPRHDRLERLNDQGSFIWMMIAERRHTEQQIANALVLKFAVELDVASADLHDFIVELSAKGLIESP